MKYFFYQSYLNSWFSEYSFHCFLSLNDQIFKLRQQTQIFWDQYLSSVRSILLTTLEIIRQRINLHLASSLQGHLFLTIFVFIVFNVSLNHSWVTLNWNLCYYYQLTNPLINMLILLLVWNSRPGIFFTEFQTYQDNDDGVCMVISTVR